MRLASPRLASHGCALIRTGWGYGSFGKWCRLCVGWSNSSGCRCRFGVGLVFLEQIGMVGRLVGAL
eukprot:42079-Lingulodinium_polyedra.AAC.1